ncbi:MAG: molybdopterin synthase sulfur carrier subunit [Rhodothalassiaceae bacterium]|nr:MAG: molybdopterin synthase sulfur carrier subunit [Rhodothalassiaceae bacterium]
MTGERTARITVLFFAALRERAGTGAEEIAWPAAGAPVRRLLDALAARDEALAAAVGSPDLRIAVNQRYADADTLVRPGDEVALFPPVTGG